MAFRDGLLDQLRRAVLHDVEQVDIAFDRRLAPDLGLAVCRSKSPTGGGVQVSSTSMPVSAIIPRLAASLPSS